MIATIKFIVFFLIIKLQFSFLISTISLTKNGWKNSPSFIIPQFFIQEDVEIHWIAIYSYKNVLVMNGKMKKMNEKMNSDEWEDEKNEWEDEKRLL